MKRVKKFLWALLVLSALLTVGCGQKDGQTTPVGGEEYVYVPEILSLEGVEGPKNITAKGEYMYYSVMILDEDHRHVGDEIYRMNLASEQPEKLPVDHSAQGNKVNVMSLAPDNEGNLYVFYADYSVMEESETNWPRISLAKYDGGWEERYVLDVTGPFKEQGFSDIRAACVDGEDRLYVSLGGMIFLFDENGGFQGRIETGGDILALGAGKDGRVYCSLYGMASGLCQVDYESGKLGDLYGDLTSIRGFAPGLEKDLLCYDQTCVYEYDPGTRTCQTLFSWADHDVYGSNVLVAFPLAEDKLAVLCDLAGDMELVRISLTAAGQAPQKKEIVVGMIHDSAQSLIANFNRYNTEYHAVAKVYFDSKNAPTGWSREDLKAWGDLEADALQALVMDIISGNGPDVIALKTGMDLQDLARNGVLENLTPWLETSEKLRPEDYVESVLAAYTFGGVLTTIPKNFSVRIVAGRASQVGEDMGWTLDEMIALMDQHPDALPFYNMDRSDILQVCLSFSQSAFIDWENGNCYFDTDEFKKVLEFVSRFPAEHPFLFPSWGDPSDLTMIIAGDILLYQTDISQAGSVTEVPQYFGGEEVTYVGYPTEDGGPVCILKPSGDIYGIAANSEHKEGAWAFVEWYLADKEGSAFPSRKDWLERQFEDDMGQDPYERDENGDVALDEKREPIRHSTGGQLSLDGISTYHYVPLPEDVELVRELIAVAKPISAGSNEIINIILEEAEAYFQGQKSVDEVAGIIQGKMKMYVSERY